MVFVVVSMPIWTTFQKSLRVGELTWHWTLLGLTTPFVETLHVIPSFYSQGDFYSDSQVSAAVHSFGERILHAGYFNYQSHLYEIASKKLYLENIKTFPADFFIKAYGSILRISDIGHVSLMILFVLALAWNNLKLSCFALLGGLYFFGYPSIQFDLRHYFYLYFCFWWLYAYFLYHFCLICFTPSGRQDFLTRWRASLTIAESKKIFTYVITIFIVLTLPLLLLRIYQARQVRFLVESYLAAPQIEIPYKKQLVDKKDLFYQFIWLPLPQRLSGKMLRFLIGGQICAGRSLAITLQYKANYSDFDFTQTFNVVVPAKNPTMDVFVPVYFYQNGKVWGKAEGVKIAGKNASCLLGLHQLRNFNSYPLWLTLILPGGWQKKNLYQQLDWKVYF